MDVKFWYQIGEVSAYAASFRHKKRFTPATNTQPPTCLLNLCMNLQVNEPVDVEITLLSNEFDTIRKMSIVPETRNLPDKVYRAKIFLAPFRYVTFGGKA